MSEWTWIKDLGVAGLIFIPFLFLLRWVLAEMKLILEREFTERNQWAGIIRGFQDSINEHTAQAKIFSEGVVEAHRFQRAEHEKMIDNLDEQGKVLARINGYKDK